MITINRVALLVVLCIVLSAQLKAQNEQFATPVVEYGDLSELAGKHRVFVHSENLESRGKIVKALEKSKYRHFEVVGRIADADFLIIYGSNLMRNNATSFTESTGDTTVVYGDLVVLTLNSSPKSNSNRKKAAPTLSATSTRIIWSTRKGRMFLRTSQFFRPFQPTLGGAKSSWITILANLLFSHPKLAWLPLSRSNTEKAAVRQFIKAMRKADESPKPDKIVTLPLLTKPAPVIRKPVFRKSVPAPRRRQRFRRKL